MDAPIQTQFYKDQRFSKVIILAKKNLRLAGALPLHPEENNQIIQITKLSIIVREGPDRADKKGDVVAPEDSAIIETDEESGPRSPIVGTPAPSLLGIKDLIDI